MIPQKSQSDEGRECWCWLGAAYSIRHTTLLLLPDGIVFAELGNSRIVGHPEVEANSWIASGLPALADFQGDEVKE